MNARLPAGSARTLIVALLLLAATVIAQPPGVPAPVGPSAMPVPAVSVRVRVPAVAAPGAELTYRILVENSSRAEAHHVTVRAAFTGVEVVKSSREPDSTTPVATWNLGTMKGCDKQEIVVTAKAGEDGEAGCTARVQFEHGQTVKTSLRSGAKAGNGDNKAAPFVPVPKDKPKVMPKIGGKEPPKTKDKVFEPAEADGVLQVRKVVKGKAFALNAAIPCKIEVKNVGATALKNVVVEEKLQKGLFFFKSHAAGKDGPAAVTTGEDSVKWTIAELPAGKTRVIEYDMSSDLVGEMRCRLTATSDTGPKAEASATIRVGKPSLKVVASGPAQRAVGKDAVYSLTVWNKGDAPASGVTLTDELFDEKGVKLDGLEVTDNGGGSRVGEAVKWKLGDLAPGEAKTVTMTVKATKAGLHQNTVVADADGGIKEFDQNKTTFIDADTFFAETARGKEPFRAGQKTAFVVSLVNGTAAEEKAVKLALTFPPGCRVLSLTTPAGPVGGLVPGSKTVTVGDQGGIGVPPGKRLDFRVEAEMTQPGTVRLGVEPSSERTRKAGGVAVRFEEIFEVLPR